jgi:hypothetical protein
MSVSLSRDELTILLSLLVAVQFRLKMLNRINAEVDGFGESQDRAA